MPSIREQAVITLRVDGDGKVVGQLRNVQAATEKTFASTEKAMSAMERSITSGFRSMINQYASFVAAWQAGTKVLSSGIEFNKFVENQTMSFTVMMKSASGAKKQMEDLYNFAVNSPLTFKETAGSAKQLMAYGFAAKELIPTMKSLGAVAIATGNRLDDISYVYGTLRSQGRAYSRDLMQFGMRGIPIYEELAKVMGVSADQIQKLASQGKIGFKQVEQAFKNMTTEGGKFSGIIDGYMQTLTGKLSMFGDIAEQTSGRLMKPATDALKVAVDELTATFQSLAFQEYIADMARGIGDLATRLLGMLNTLVKALPIITKIASLILTIMAIKFAKSALFALPDMLLSAATSMSKIAVSGGAVGLLMDNIATGAGLFTSYLKDALPVLLTSLGAFAAIVAAVAAVSAGMAYMRKEAEKNRQSANPNVRAKQLSEDYYVAPFSLKQAFSSKTTADDVTKIAEQYQLAEGVVAKILIQNGVLEQSSWNQYLNTKAAKKGLEEYAKVQEGIQHVAKTMEQDQMEFLSKLTGLPAAVYEDLSNVDLNALGNKGAKDYIAAFASERQKEKDIFGIAYSTDMLKDSLQKEADGITEALRSGAEVPGLFNTKYDETLRERLLTINKELDGLGKKSQDLYKKLKDLGMWWLPKEAAVAVTATSIDDIALVGEKAVYNAQNEIDARRSILEENLAITASMEDGAEKTALQLDYMRQLLEIEDKRKQIIADTTKVQARQKSIGIFNEAVEGNSAVFETLKARAADALTEAFQIAARNPDFKADLAIAGRTASGIGAAAATSAQGTELGNIGSNFLANGAQAGIIGIILNIISSFTKFLSSIEAVNKAMNPFTTMLEAGRDVLEPLLAAASGPLVKFLEQFGKALADILTPFIQLWQVVESLSYLINLQFLAPLQIMGKAMTWLADNVIVPVGNFIIDSINAVIRVINMIPGVEIEYLDRLETSVERITNALNAQMLIDTMEYAVNKMNNLIDDQIASWQDLYEVGAITGSQYESEVTRLNETKVDLDQKLVDATVKEMETIQELNAWIQSNMGAYLTAKGVTTTYGAQAAGKISMDTGVAAEKIIGAVAGGVIGTLIGAPVVGALVGGAVGGDIVDAGADVIDTVSDWIGGWFDVGTPNVPRDMVAQIHKGEGIIPATFMDGIRSGELTLGSGDMGMGGQSVNVTVIVQGSVTAENDLADTVAEAISIRRSRGILTV